MINEAAIRRRFETLGPYLDERQRRVYATSEALAAGWGGMPRCLELPGLPAAPLAAVWMSLRSAGGQMVECAGWGLAANCWKRPTRG